MKKFLGWCLILSPFLMTFVIIGHEVSYMLSASIMIFSGLMSAAIILGCYLVNDDWVCK